ncbi:hypothetical protein KBK19_18825 [Microvirga sp. STR05]|uniref:Uncharacterized protein n=1 Tax=Hymenobacter duratus TaxID=2771356 RepID=A0ABR8JJT5_9BACT|nr:cell division protein ZapB [Hymenobacter duratus]MBD2717105.1 hypothetical protein [Hymenobacter duratus]MBR7952021.1 hypothetical protein [Microvirga sp. STR05]
MRIILCIATSLLLTVGMYDVKGQAAVPVSPSQGQVAELKRENIRLKEDLAQLREDVDRLKQIHSEDNARAKEQQKEISDDVKDIKPFAEYWKLFLLSIVGVGSLWGLWIYFKTIPAIAKKEFEARMSSIFQDKADDLYALMSGYDLDQAIKKKYKIVLLSHMDDGYHRTLLTENGFEVEYHPRIASLSEANTFASIQPENVVIINNEDGHWDPEQVQTFINGVPNHCFYIGKHHVPIQGEALHRFAAVNFRAQFIGNLMNVLRYRS